MATRSSFDFRRRPEYRASGSIDSYRGAKTVALIRDLSPPAPAAPRIRFVCATHPHLDHISGLRNVLTTFAGRVEEFWDSGFRFTGTTYRNLIEEVEKQGLRHRLRLLRPTSGFEFFHAGAALSILSPSISLRNRYDTYGVDINNASIVVRLTYPVGKPSLEYPKTDGPPPAGDAAPNSTTVILGGDAQSDAWGQVLQEFPHLDPDERQWARAIAAKNGRTPLRCDLFKVSHHCSKRGINLELIERLGDTGSTFGSTGPPLLISSARPMRTPSMAFRTPSRRASCARFATRRPRPAESMATMTSSASTTPRSASPAPAAARPARSRTS